MRALSAAREYFGARWRFRRLRGEALTAWQDRHATAAARFAFEHAPFYRKLGASSELTPARWRELPVIDKALMMSRFEEFNTRGVSSERALAVALESERTRDYSPTVDNLAIILSSGTSGNRTISLVDEHEQMGFIGFFLARMFDGISIKKRRLAFFLRSNSNVYESSNGPLVDFHYFDLALTREELAARLAALQPQVIVGPPGLLVIVASLVEEGKLSLSPELVYSGGEVLERQDRERLERTFGVMVRDLYHTSEGPIALPCRAGKLHIQEDIAHVELEPLGDGRYTPIVTQLFRRVQPFLRYRMNDVVLLDEKPCPCGSSFRVLESVEGRCDDILYVRAPDKRLRHVFPDELRRAVLAVDGVREYRAEQLTPEHFRIYVDAASDVSAALIAAVRARLPECDPPRIEVIQGLPVGVDPRKKLVRVRRMFRLEDLDANEVV